MDKNKDIELWNQYTAYKRPEDQAALLNQFAPIIHGQVNKWAGPVPRTVLSNEAKLLALKAFDTYDPNRGTALATHVTNNLAPISRIVYTHQNTARLPENITLKVSAYKQAVDKLLTLKGRDPMVDELHQELGWPVNEINRIQSYLTKDLVESQGGLSDSFYSNNEDSEADMMSAIYYDLSPTEKQLMEHTTGYNGKPKLSNPQIMRAMGLTQAQLSYQRTLLTRKINKLLGRG